MDLLHMTQSYKTIRTANTQTNPSISFASRKPTNMVIPNETHLLSPPFLNLSCISAIFSTSCSILPL
ncbi:hypothetical protein FKM82_004233 [Ascaphus truei]